MALQCDDDNTNKLQIGNFKNNNITANNQIIHVKIFFSY